MNPYARFSREELEHMLHLMQVLARFSGVDNETAKEAGMCVLLDNQQ